jgi:hypothetical protein
MYTERIHPVHLISSTINRNLRLHMKIMYTTSARKLCKVATERVSSLRIWTNPRCGAKLHVEKKYKQAAAKQAAANALG